MKSEYALFSPPFILNFKEMSNKQAKEYLIWFIDQIPGRILELSRYIKSFSDFSNWEPDLTPSSLESLGEWFYNRVKTRSRSRNELEDIYTGAPAWFRSIEIPDWELTDETLSLSIDIGMYLSQVMEENIPGLRWRKGSGSKMNKDYQQPVLVGTGKLVFNPVHIVTTLAYGIANRTQGTQRLRELYDIWLNLFQGE